MFNISFFTPIIHSKINHEFLFQTNKQNVLQKKEIAFNNTKGNSIKGSEETTSYSENLLSRNENASILSLASLPAQAEGVVGKANTLITTFKELKSERNLQTKRVQDLIRRSQQFQKSLVNEGR